MPFQIAPLSPEPFAPLFELDDDELARRGAVRRRVDVAPGFPCRVSLADAAPGEEVLLVNYEHQPALTPFRARHAIYVRPGVEAATPAPGEVPEALHRRTLSLRAFDAAHMLIAAELATGDAIALAAERLLDDPATAYVHAHFAAMGCFAARVGRA